ncbi:MAG TPA: hypothetical protein VKB50_11960 [Vicinamibacterales bacterium]|nr:hypothetical protein [Vicinamibacterales bacterium]
MSSQVFRLKQRGGGKVRPSTDALERFAQATGTRLRIVFEPQSAR